MATKTVGKLTITKGGVLTEHNVKAALARYKFTDAEWESIPRVCRVKIINRMWDDFLDFEEDDEDR